MGSVGRYLSRKRMREVESDGDMKMEMINGISGKDGSKNGCRISFEIWNYGSENEESGINGEI
jgi:hypothetical protein